MEVNSFKCKIAGALAGGVLGTGKALVTHQQAEGRQGRVTSELSAIVP